MEKKSVQQSSLLVFCEECGLANDPAASHCAACRHPLTMRGVSAPPVAPLKVAPAPVLEVTLAPRLAAGRPRILVENLGPLGQFCRGTVLDGRYEILEEIGQGGFSTVYRAKEIGGNGREVAIKRIELSRLSPRQIIDATETFNREITMLARFKGVPGVPTFYEQLTDSENWYLVMQYIEGQTLEEYLQKKPGGYLKEEEVIQIGCELAELMKHLHASHPSVVFRDLKPANIMVTPKREYYLIDFGIARNYTPGKAKDTTPLGSPGYAPPEQYGRAQTDHRSDIYSLGATLQTLLTGRDPLELRAGVPSRNSRPPSRELSRLLDQMLATDPNQRPSRMTQVKNLLEALPYPHSALISYGLGLVLGTIFGIGILLSLFVGGGGFFWVSYMLMIALSGFWQPIRRRLHARKVSSLFVCLGILTPLVFVLLFWLWRVFGWPI
jgi:tRNA A-37 threonylcarbamoyl transferase component Bud32